jgi:hypothetical protein
MKVLAALRRIETRPDKRRVMQRLTFDQSPIDIQRRREVSFHSHSKMSSTGRVIIRR